jgi:arylformamidase
MKIHDVTLTVSPDLPVWPGDPFIHLERVSKIEAGANANVSVVSMGVHSGTHVDAPCHFLPAGKGVEQLDLNVLIGPALVCELSSKTETISSLVIKNLDIPKGTQRLLFKTRNSACWASGVKEFQPDFVGVDLDGANYLAESGIKLVGIDYLSVSPYKESRPTHEALLNNEIVIIEGLNLSAVEPGLYMLYCLPVKLMGSDGAPARVVLIED